MGGHSVGCGCSRYIHLVILKQKNMKQNIVLFLVLLLGACSQPTNNKVVTIDKPYSAEGKKVIVYSTADSSNLRLSVTDTLSFKTLAQPLETQVCVFVDPSKTFQTFLGIGGALTDASAETFAKLPKNKQQEFLKAYYNAKDGIGYTIARTNINYINYH